MKQASRWLLLTTISVILPAAGAAQEPSSAGNAAARIKIRELRRFPAAEATQGVAVDGRHFYAVGNHSIGKYDKKNGKRTAGWECPEGRPLIHLNSGVVHEGKLYCAHSNYPGVPMTSSIEIWDTESMRHIDHRSFGIYVGSATWVDFHKGFWYVAFAHYANRAAEPNRDPRWTTILQFDRAWNRLQGWVFPGALLERFAPSSNSGGVFTGEGLLYCTGHDAPEIYVMKFPEGGSTLEWVETLGFASPGQGIALDPYEPGLLYSIHKANREVIVSQISP
ncbi:MAG: hypothetical protein HXY20_01685 [Acidobacteria bacterium]|nr:hypothetical protein [Acidobacteriota bacterium]